MEIKVGSDTYWKEGNQWYRKLSLNEVCFCLDEFKLVGNMEDNWDRLSSMNSKLFDKFVAMIFIGRRPCVKPAGVPDGQ